MSTYRAEYTAGLRLLADLLDAHEEIPLPYDGSAGSGITISFLHDSATAKDEIARVVRLLPGTWVKNDPSSGDYAASYYELSGALHGLHVDLVAFRDAVCERVAVAEREVTEEVPDPDAPLVTVIRKVTEYEWRCHPLLAVVEADAALSGAKS